MPGTIIIFDDLINYRSWRKHEYKAWMKFVEVNKVEFRYIAFSGMKATVQIDAVSGYSTIKKIFP
jgi:hypothetical protein